MSWISVENYISNLDKMNDENKQLTTGQLLDRKQKKREEELKMQELYYKVARELIDKYVDKNIKSGEIAALLGKTNFEKFYFDKLNSELKNDGYILVRISFGVLSVKKITDGITPTTISKPIETKVANLAIPKNKNKIEKQIDKQPVSKAKDSTQVIAKPDQKQSSVDEKELVVPIEAILKKQECSTKKEDMFAFSLLKTHLGDPKLIIEFNDFLRSKKIDLKVVIKDIDIVQHEYPLKYLEKYDVEAANPSAGFNDHISLAEEYHLLDIENIPDNNVIQSDVSVHDESKVPDNKQKLEQKFDRISGDSSIPVLSAKRCPECGNIVYSKSAEGLPSRCFKCNTNFPTLKQIQTHYKCPCCGKTLRLTTDMDIETLHCIECNAPIDLEYNEHKHIKHNI